MAKSFLIKLLMLGVVFGGLALWGGHIPESNQGNPQKKVLPPLQPQGIQSLPGIVKKHTKTRNAIPSLPQTSESVRNPLVDLNSGTLDELVQLPGIGKVLARRIIEYRQKEGPFVTLDELKNVSGIGDKRMAQVKRLLTTDVKQGNAS